MSVTVSPGWAGWIGPGQAGLGWFITDIGYLVSQKKNRVSETSHCLKSRMTVVLVFWFAGRHMFLTSYF